MARQLHICRPDQVAALLPAAMGGGLVLAPVAEDSVARVLRPEVPVSEPDAAVVVTTSGSTGHPKQVVLSATAIRAAAASFRTRYGVFTWTCALPVHYVAGLMVVARGQLDAQWGGSGVRFAGTDLAGLDPAPGRNAISIVPTQLVRALRDPQLVAALARFDAVLVGGAALPSEVVAQSREAGIPVLTSYGMSETCGGCVFDGLPLPGVEVSLGEAGRISLGGDMVFSGYRLDPDETARALVAGRVLTNDRGEWRDGRLRVLGRFDDVVISGGINVDLAAVQAAVAGLVPGEAWVTAVDDAEWGSRVVLVTTVERGDLDWWRTRLRPALEPAALPRQLVVVPRIPTTSSGKVDRRELRRLAQAAG